MTVTQKHGDIDVVPCWINGKAAPLDAKNLIEVTSSALGKKVHYAQSASAETAISAVNSAAESFKDFSQVPYNKRRELLMKAADVLESRVDELIARYQMEETPCPEMWGRFNVVIAAKAVREIAGSITVACMGETPPPETADAFCLVYKHPIGPVLSMAPWNRSIILSCRSLAAPLCWMYRSLQSL